MKLLPLFPPYRVFFCSAVLCCIGLSVFWAHSIFGQDHSKTSEEKLTFNRDIRPLLADRCFACHGPDANKRAAELRLDLPPTQELLARKIFNSAEPEKSELIARILSTDPSSVMPPPDFGKVLSPEERKRLETWIQQGAEYESHWVWAPLMQPQVPANSIHGNFGSANPIDSFLAASTHGAALSDYQTADTYTILRRLSFDLTGLPPNQEDLAWLAEQLSLQTNSSPQQSPMVDWERIIDRKLASPAYGERMSVWWLDLVRYADTVGYHGDQEHHAAPYRDWVIRAFNNNTPFDEFTRLQLAGDLLPESGDFGKIASAYNRLLQTSHEGGVQAKEYLAKYSADRVRNFSLVCLGLTVGCAECHDHKFDPISQRDFYQLASFFADLDEMQTFKGGDTSPTKRFPEIDVVSPLNESTPMRVMISKSVEPRVIRVLPRGNWLDDTGEIVSPNVPATLATLAVPERRSTRLDLANWLFDANRAMSARVTVNRLWALYFGSGIATSLEDYGSQGTPPSHPELLDWLANELILSDWDIKHIVRLIVSSEAYRSASTHSTVRTSNSFLHPLPRRIPAEFLRDSLLQASGLLDHKMGGESVRPYQPDGYYNHLNFPPRKYTASTGGDQYRRGVYTHWQRQFLHPMLRNFDAPSREECTAQRSQSNTPTQMLVLLNDPTYIEAARGLAWSAINDADCTAKDRASKIAYQIWLRALSRPPTQQEEALLIALQEKQLQQFSETPQQRDEFLIIGQWRVPHRDLLTEQEVNDLAAWSFVARSVLMLNESLTLY